MELDIKPILIFQGIYAKYKIEDPKIRKKIESTFGPLLLKIIEKIPFEKRSVILDPFIKMIVSYSAVGTKNLKQVTEVTKFLATSYAASLTYATYEKKPSDVDRILHEVFFDDLVCDLGKTIESYKTSKNRIERKTLRAKIEFLLGDYNEITGNKLTFMDVLKKKETL